MKTLLLIFAVLTPVALAVVGGTIWVLDRKGLIKNAKDEQP